MARAMTGTVEWPVLLTIVAAVVAAGGIIGAVIVRAFSWLYAESNRQRAQNDAMRTAHGAEIEKLRTDLMTVRTEIAHTYVTIEGQKMLRESLERRSEHLEKAVEKISEAVDRMAEKQDQAMHELLRAFSAKVAAE